SPEIAPVGRRRPGRDGSFADGLRWIGDDPRQVELGRPAEALAGRAGPERAVEPEEPGLRREMIGAAPAAPPAAHEGPRRRAPPAPRARPRPGPGPGRRAFSTYPGRPRAPPSPRPSRPPIPPPDPASGSASSGSSSRRIRPAAAMRPNPSARTARTTAARSV